MTATYRGGGRPSGTLDFTPAFYDAHYGQAGTPAALKAQCASLDRAASAGFDKRIDCFEQTTSAKCAKSIKAAKAAQDADIPKRAACLKVGEIAYTRRQTDPSERRTNACNYTLLSLDGSGSKHWHKLLPAVCRRAPMSINSAWIARVRFAAANGQECIKFFPKQ